ncbi:hypothetical protein H5410_051695, partial [Solanum commersonii]
MFLTNLFQIDFVNNGLYMVPHLEQDNTFFEDIALMYFFIEFSIPWIMKLSVENFLYKVLEQINTKRPRRKNSWSRNYRFNKYNDGQISKYRKIKTIGLISKSEAIAIYMEEVKRDLMKNLDTDIKDDISMASASHTNDGEESCMVGEEQSANNNEEIDIDTLLQRLQDQVEESSGNTAYKEKGKVKERRPHKLNSWGNKSKTLIKHAMIIS